MKFLIWQKVYTDIIFAYNNSNTMKAMNKKSKYGLKLQRVAIGGSAIWMLVLNGLVSAT